MSHFPVVVIVPGDVPEVGEAADRLLAPFDEQGEWSRDGSRWDWYVLGGRWTGALDGYDPTTDPANIVTCDLCSGTGTRPEWPAECTAEWIAECNGCNGCSGNGTRLRWDFVPHMGDVWPVSEITTIPDRFVPNAILTPDGTWHERAVIGMFGMELEVKESDGDWLAVVAKLLDEHANDIALIIDCHV